MTRSRLSPSARVALLIAGVIAAPVARAVWAGLLSWLRLDDVSAAFVSALLVCLLIFLPAVVVSALLRRDERWELALHDRAAWDREWLNWLIVFASAAIGGGLAVASGASEESLNVLSAGLAFGLLAVCMWFKMRVAESTYEQLAEQAAARGEDELAVRLITEAVVRARKPPEERLIRRCELLIAAGEFDEAVRELNDCVREFPGSVRPGELRLEARVARRQRAEAGSRRELVCCQWPRESDMTVREDALQEELNTLRRENRELRKGQGGKFPSSLLALVATGVLSGVALLIAEPEDTRGNSGTMPKAQTVPLTLTTLEPGTIIRASDVGFGPAPVNEIGEDTLLTMEEIVGKRVIKPVPSVEPVSSHWVEAIVDGPPTGD